MSYLGIRGFESILRGGIPERAEVLLLTPEGRERHLLGSHWIVEGIGRGERALAVIAGEDPQAFLGRLGRMGVDTSAAIAAGSLVIVDWYTCWTQAVEGVREVNRTFRASRRPDDLVAAIDRAVPALFSAEKRRAFIDVLPLAYKALEEVQVVELLSSIRGVLSEAGVSALYAADRGLPTGRLDTLLQAFHAVLDARREEPEVLAFAVLGVGGVKVDPRYRRVRVREDGAALESEPGTRTFSCPICDARVSFEAARCPSCGSPRSDMGEAVSEPGLMNYLESLQGKGPTAGKVSAPPPARAAAPGVTNGVRPSGRVNGAAPSRVNGTATGRVNGIAPGRVNGIAPKGRTNGLATTEGMVNGTRGRTTGVTNGLTNGLLRARSGITNGLTNGSGFTNGLGSRRARTETRRARWKLFLVPLLSAILLISPLLLSETPAKPARAIDGDFSDWIGVAGYTQTPPSDINPGVALNAYRVNLATGAGGEPDALYLYASVAGTWFADTAAQDVLYVFVHTGAAADTRYRVSSFDADLMASVSGSDGAISMTSMRSFSGSDADNWTAWTPTGDYVSAAFGGGSLEMSIPWATASWGTSPSILLLAEDGLGNRSYSIAFGPALGALRATVRGLTDRVSASVADFLAVDVQAFGGPVSVTDLQVVVSSGTIILPTLPATISAGAPQSLTVKVDASTVSQGTLITATVNGVVSDRPVLLSGGAVRAYVGAAPMGKTVDGWFGDWGPDLQNDTDAARVEPDRDLDRSSSNRTGTTLFLYADVKGTLLAGAPIPIRRTRWEPGSGPSSTAPQVPLRNAGTDVLRVYIDTNSAVAAGLPIHGLRGADLLIEIDGIHGQITGRTAFGWANGWQPLSPPNALNDERRLEASIPVPSTGAIEVVFETLGWEGPGDTTEPAATRGVRPTSDGGYVYEGRFTATFDPSGQVSFAAKKASFTRTLALPYIEGSPAATWAIEPTAIGVRFSRAAVEVQFILDDSGVKESLRLSRSDLPLALVSALAWGSDTTFEVGGPASSIGILGGRDRVFDLDPPTAASADGRAMALGYDLDLVSHELRLPLPPQLQSVGYPIVIYAVTAWTLRDDGPTYKVGEQMGWSVAVGDFNGDGYADVLTGAPSWGYTGHTNIGYAYVYYGPFTADKTSPDVRLNGTTDGGTFGYAVAAGKFNNDSYWDVLVARHSILSNVGPVCIFYGSSTWNGTVSTCDVKFEPPSDFNNYGVAVAAGNVDNAYDDDVLVGSSGHDNDSNGLPGDGVVYVYKSPYSSGADISTANYTLYPSSNSSGQLGKSLAVGPIDSDAYQDVVAGEPAYTVSGCGGRFQFYKGINLVSGSGNRFPNATVTPSSGCGAAAWQFGASIALGKLNSDNYLDVIVGAPTKGTSNGAALLFLANSGGSGLTTGAAPNITIVNQQAGERFGTSVAIADLANDNIGDAIVGGPFYDSGGSTLTGRVYWFNNPLVDQTPDATWTGAQNAERFGQSLAVGKFSGDVRPQVAIGAYLWDKNSGNPSDNDGRVVVAAAPEGLVLLLLAAPTILVLFRARWARSRRKERLSPAT